MTRRTPDERSTNADRLMNAGRSTNADRLMNAGRSTNADRLMNAGRLTRVGDRGRPDPPSSTSTLDRVPKSE